LFLSKNTKKVFFFLVILSEIFLLNAIEKTKPETAILLVSSAENLLWIKILFGIVDNKMIKAKVKENKSTF
jgi:hypothetical protein